MSELKQVLGYKTILALAIGSIVGTALFFGPAIAASISGNASIIAWIIVALMAIYISFCFAELSSMFPHAGGVYEFTKHAYGKLTSFTIGWLTWLIGNITTALLVVAAIDYLVPVELNTLKMGVSIGFVLLLNFIALIGIEASSIALIFFAVITVGLILTIILRGIFFVDITNIVPLVAAKPSLIFLSIFFIIETFFGWEAVTFLAEETKNPRKIIPKSLIIATVAVAVLSILLPLVIIGVIPIDILSSSVAPINNIVKVIFGAWAIDMFSIGVYLIMIGGAAGAIVSLPRLLMALARDDLFIKGFKDIHHKFKTPYKAIILQTIFAILLIFFGFGRYKTLLELLIPLAFILYAFVLFSLTILRYKKPHIKRFFKAPFGKIGPSIIIIIFIALLIMWIYYFPYAFNSLIFSFSIALTGLPIYVLLQMYHNPRVILIVNDFLAYFALLTEKFFLPIRVRKELIDLLGHIKGKKILEYGCSVGSLTRFLAREVGENGKIYAMDISEHEVKIARKRLFKHKHVKIFKTHTNRVNEDVPDVNAAISVGMIGYLQYIHHVLNEINKRLDKGEKIVVMDYDNFFFFIPNVDWLSDDNEIRKIFEKSGFRVNVIRKRGLFWQYVYIYGIKVKNIR